MMRLVLVVAALAAAAAALPADMPDPGELVFVLNEDDWDDYLDAWLAVEEQKWGSNVTSKNAARSGKEYFYEIDTNRLLDRFINVEVNWPFFQAVPSG